MTNDQTDARLSGVACSLSPFPNALELLEVQPCVAACSQLGRCRQVDQDFKVILNYIASLGSA